MEKKDVLKNLLKNEYTNLYNGISISKIDNELLIKGTKSDLLDLANYIVDTALSDNNKDHIHLNEEILLSNNSEVKELIIEKE